MLRLAANIEARRELESLQARRLAALLAEVLSLNSFYIRKLASARLEPEELRTPANLCLLPFTTKAELLDAQEQNPPYGQILTYPPHRYSRMHQTSGSTGKPLCWLDTPESWAWCLENWRQIYDIVGLRPDDCLYFAFSFGPFLGFWTAFETAANRGNLCLPGGGLSSVARLRAILEGRATVVLCTPTYALRLAEVAAAEGIDLAGSPVRALIVAGEPGGSIPQTRRRIEQTWGARVFDHHGMTEIGPAAVECIQNPGGMHLLESEYIAEIIDPGTESPVPPGEVGELVLTNLGRAGSPLLRYRTGDLVRADTSPCPCGRSFLRFDGGILGRSDDMIVIRGNNVFPSALEAILRQFEEVAEYRIEVDASSTLPELRVEVEPTTAELGTSVVERVDRAIRDELLFRAVVTAVPPGSLPRYEFKAKRIWIRTTEAHSHREENKENSR
jgi:phenylacetate-CoA ligase